MKVKKEVEFSKEVLDVGEAFEAVCVAYKTAVADGFQAGTDVPTILAASFSGLLKAFEGAQEIGVEFKDDMAASINALFVPINRGVCLLVKK